MNRLGGGRLLVNDEKLTGIEVGLTIREIFGFADVDDQGREQYIDLVGGEGVIKPIVAEVDKFDVEVEFTADGIGEIDVEPFDCSAVAVFKGGVAGIETDAQGLGALNALPCGVCRLAGGEEEENKKKR